MPRAIKGVLVECDPHIKYLIVMIDSENHDFIIEDLDDRRLVIKENMVKELQMRLEERLREQTKQQNSSSSGSESEGQE